MRYFIKLVLIITTTAFYSSFSYCQNNPFKQIENQIKESDSLRVLNYPDSAKNILNATLLISDSLSYDSLTLVILHDLITIYSKDVSSKEITSLYNTYLKTPDKYPNSLNEYKSILLLIFHAERILGNYDSALEVIYKYEELIDKYSFDKSKISPPELFLGELYFHREDYNKALEYLFEAKKELVNSKSYFKSYNINMISKVYFKLDSIDQGAKYFSLYTDMFQLHEQDIELRSNHFSSFPDAMLDYFTEDKLLEIYTHQNISKVVKNNMGFVLASYYKKNKEPSKAITYWKNCLEKGENFDNYNLYPLQQVYQAYLEINQLDSAKYYLDLFLLSSKEVYNLEKDKQFKEVNSKYQSAKKDAEIQRQKSGKSIILITSFLSVISIISIFLFFLNRIKNKKLVAEKELEIRNQKIRDLEKEKKLISMASVLEGQEAERIRIAKDLHDGLGGLLSSVKVHLSNIQGEVQNIENINVFQQTNSMIDEACDEVRRITHNLMPGTLRLEGLKIAIEGLAEDLSSIHPFQVRTEFIGFIGMLDEKTEVFLYRIIQESLNNIIKYANAKNVLIQAIENDDNYNLFVEDDGVGFDISSVENGLGLKSMRSRVEFLNGHFDIASKIDQGTTITISFPKKKTNSNS